AALRGLVLPALAAAGIALVGHPAGEDRLATALLTATLGIALDCDVAGELDVHIHPAATAALAGVDDLVAVDDDARPPRLGAGGRVAGLGRPEILGYHEALLLEPRGHIPRRRPAVLGRAAHGRRHHWLQLLEQRPRGRIHLRPDRRPDVEERQRGVQERP